MKLNPVELKPQELAKLIDKLFRFEYTKYGWSTEQVYIVTDAQFDRWGESVIFYQRISTGSNFRCCANHPVLNMIEWLTP